MGRQLVRDSGALRHPELSAANVQPAGPGCGLCPDAGQTPRGIHNVSARETGCCWGDQGCWCPQIRRCP